MSTKIIVPTILATVNPTVSDDRSTGMHVGFRWLNTTTPAEFVCTNDAAGAAVWSSVGGGGGGAPTGAQYITLATDGTLTNERVLTAGTGITLTDAGAGSTLTIASSGGAVPGLGVIQQFKKGIDEVDRNTTSSSLVATSLTIAFDNNLKKSSNLVRVRFIINVTSTAACTISFTIKRAGTSLTPAGSDCITTSAIFGNDYSNTVVVEFIDTPGSIAPGTYELWWKTSVGTAKINYLTTTGYATPTTMTLEEIDPAPGGLTGNASVAILEDQKTQNTAGGTFTSGSWVTRTLNTEVDPDGIVTLASDQFTLDPGTYIISGRAPAGCATGCRHQARVYNVTDSSVAILGSSSYVATIQTDSIFCGTITITAQKTFRIEHRTQTTQSSDGLGIASNFVTELYTSVKIEKLTPVAQYFVPTNNLFLAERYN
jgi:hypothetical protein